MKNIANIPHLSYNIHFENTGIILLMLKKTQILSNHRII